MRRVVYRYPIQHENNEYFINLLIKFIENDILSKKCYEIQKTSTTFYTEYVDGEINFIDDINFKDNESKYLRHKEK